MKQIIFLELIRKLKAKPHLIRKIKIFAVVGVAGFFVTGALAIWAGVSAISYVADKANVVMQSAQTAAHIENLKTEVKGLSLQPLNCWGKAQSLMAVEPWLARPALDNLKNLKVACLEATTPVCEGHECSQMKKLIHTTEGKMI
ncbi:MAG TPA: hypothetical protein PLJ21_05470 [Pseudobdellovibrionaceae bacterium]|nr:hypothetical protein [Pseudobdellovibrionaceae bacterium]